MKKLLLDFNIKLLKDFLGEKPLCYHYLTIIYFVSRCVWSKTFLSTCTIILFEQFARELIDARQFGWKH